MKTRRLVRQHWLLLTILAFALITRAAAALYLGNQVVELPGTFDQISYHNLALRVLAGHGFSFGQEWWPLTAADAPTAHWSFLYTLYLVAVYKIFGPNPLVARLIQAMIVAVLQPTLAYLIGRHVFGKAVGLMAAALTAVYGYFVYYAGTLMTEPFYITAILASLYLTARLAEPEQKHRLAFAAGLGLSLGAAVLLRQLFLLFVPFLFAWLWWARYRLVGKLPFRESLLSAFIIIALIVPFTVYNYTRFERFVLLNTNAGYAFFWSNHPIYGTHFMPILPPEMGSYQQLIPPELRHLDEAAMDQALLRRGLEIVLEDPGRVALLSFSRVPIYFMFWPSAESGGMSNVTRVLSFGIMLPFMLYGWLYAIVHRPRINFLASPVFLLSAFAVIYSVIHLLSWTLIRYRLPVDAVMLIFAALAVVQLLSRVKLGQLDKLVVGLSES